MKLSQAIEAHAQLRSYPSGEPAIATFAHALVDRENNVVLDAQTAGGDSVEKTDSYTLVITDAGKLVAINKGTAANWTVPPNSAVPFPIGTEIAGAQLGLGAVTIVEGSGVTINSAGDLFEAADQYATWAIKKIGTNEWLLAGNLA